MIVVVVRGYEFIGQDKIRICSTLFCKDEAKSSAIKFQELKIPNDECRLGIMH